MIKWGKFTISAGTLLPLALPFQKKVNSVWISSPILSPFSPPKNKK